MNTDATPNRENFGESRNLFTVVSLLAHLHSRQERTLISKGNFKKEIIDYNLPHFHLFDHTTDERLTLVNRLDTYIFVLIFSHKQVRR